MAESKPMISLDMLLTTKEMANFMKAPMTPLIGYKVNIISDYVHLAFVDLSIGDFIKMNSYDIFDVPYTDLLIQMLYRRFEQHVKEHYKKSI